MISFEVLSIFPNLFQSYMDASIMGRARAHNLYSLTTYDLRSWTHDAHHSVDDAPYGGGQGMLMKCEPFFEAFSEISSYRAEKPYIVMFSPCGKRFTQACAAELSHKKRVLFACGHYEGIDERVYQKADAIYSLGDYVLTGAELATLVVLDATIRLIPGALGDAQSACDESFSDAGLLEYAQYTRPREVEGMRVPDVLLSGNHEAIKTWKRMNALERTARWRPDLLSRATLSDKEYDFVRNLTSHRKDM